MISGFACITMESKENRKYEFVEVEDIFNPSALHRTPSGSCPSSGAPARQGLPLPSPRQPHPSSHQPPVSPQSDSPIVGNDHN